MNSSVNDEKKISEQEKQQKCVTFSPGISWKQYGNLGDWSTTNNPPGATSLTILTLGGGGGVRIEQVCSSACAIRTFLTFLDAKAPSLS